MRAKSFPRWHGELRMVSPELRDVVVQDGEGREHKLGELWREGPAVLVFVRHFG